MMKKLMMVVGGCLLAAGVAQAERVEYRDYDANTETFTNAVRECTLVTTETRMLEDGWYAVQGTVTIPVGANLTVNGTAHLILCDGAKLSVEQPGENQPAVKTEGATLGIYGQTAGTGALVATGGEYGAGIGGGTLSDGGTVTINGGKVTATGGENSAGIGGAWDGTGGMVTINGGTVTATGGQSGAGIGGGLFGAGGTVIINGGTVTATGGAWGAGIGCGAGGTGGAVRISGGAVTAIGGKYEGVDIGVGASGGSVAISGGIFAWPIKVEWIAAGYAIGGNTDSATSTAYPYAVTPAAFTVTISEHPHSTVQWAYGNGSVMSRVTGASFKLGTGMTGVRVIFTPESGYLFVEEGETGVRTLDSPVEKDCIVDAPVVAGKPCEVTFAVGVGIRRAAYVCGGVTNELVTGETVAVVRLGTCVELIVEEEPLHYPFAGERTFTVDQETMRVEIFARPIPKGMEGNPFQIGTDVFATTNAAGVLKITGTGAMDDFASAADVPWVPATVAAVTVDAGVTQIGANAWSGMEDSVAINGTALSAVRYLAPGVGSAQPAGVISGAEFDQVQIIDGKAYLGIAVCTNGEVTAATEGWGKAKVGHAETEDDGTVTLTVPAPAERGFMILKSKGK